MLDELEKKLKIGWIEGIGMTEKFRYKWERRRCDEWESSGQTMKDKGEDYKEKRKKKTEKKKSSKKF